MPEGPGPWTAPATGAEARQNPKVLLGALPPLVLRLGPAESLLLAYSGYEEYDELIGTSSKQPTIRDKSMFWSGYPVLTYLNMLAFNEVVLVRSTTRIWM